MSSCKIRPHHGLCTAFFEGKGYSEAFTQNMTSVIAMLEKDDPEITLTIGEDIICKSCPHNKEHVCETLEKVERFDKAVLEKCGFNTNDTMKWHIFSNAVDEKIIAPKKLCEVCKDCNWQYICAEKIRNR